jgi:murein DD-endopeptidase MepM/ murein hydrolase activator NlpD
VRGGDFAVERLTLPRHLVELAPKDLERALRERDRLEALFAVSSDERLWNEGLRSPLDGVEPRRNFGRRRILNGEPRSPHSGIDYPARAGTPIRAVARGRVAMVDTLFFTGHTVIVDHGFGLFSVYAHLAAVTVEQTQLLERGAVLGRVGATGRATGPHLHLSLRLHSARVDPLDLLDTPLAR